MRNKTDPALNTLTNLLSQIHIKEYFSGLQDRLQDILVSECL